MLGALRSVQMPVITDGLLVFRQLGANLHGRKLQMLHETYAPGADTGPTMLTHDGEEAGLIIQGQIEITVGAQCETIGPGDGYYFNSSTPHRFRNVTNKDCQIVSSCTPPTF